MGRFKIALLIAVGLAAGNTTPAHAAMPLTQAPGVNAVLVATPVRLHPRYRIRGTVRPAHKTHIPSQLTEKNAYPRSLYNGPQFFNPSEPPLYDGLRQDYPGYGLYR